MGAGHSGHLRPHPGHLLWCTTTPAAHMHVACSFYPSTLQSLHSDAPSHAQCLAHAALVGFVEYPVEGLASGLAPLSDLQTDLAGALVNNSVPFGACIVPGTGPSSTVYAGQLVRAPNLAHQCRAPLMPTCSVSAAGDLAKTLSSSCFASIICTHAWVRARSVMRSMAMWRVRPGRSAAPSPSMSSPWPPPQARMHLSPLLSATPCTDQPCAA